MLLSLFGVLALSVTLGIAFTDTSPFFMFSTSELLTENPKIAPASIVQNTVATQLWRCPSDTYIVVTQPGVYAEDYSDQYAAPHLRRKISGEDGRIRSTMSVMDVLGEVDTEMIERVVKKQCGAALLRVDASTGSFTIADDPKPRIIHVDFPTLPSASKERASKLKENDVFLSSILDLLPTSKYTVIYTTTPSSTHQSSAIVEPEMYEMDSSFSSSQSHMGIKRDFSSVHNKRADDSGNVTLPDAPLFEKYQYFTPGIFMGILIMLPLFLILYVGVSAVGSLQVSYAAFEREMGPQTAKKGQ
ncbi:MAG: hypothetical protein Q9209_003630 [Squamulea sp. 1 TL-2023]